MNQDFRGANIKTGRGGAGGGDGVDVGSHYRSDIPDDNGSGTSGRPGRVGDTFNAPIDKSIVGRIPENQGEIIEVPNKSAAGTTQILSSGPGQVSSSAKESVSQEPSSKEVELQDRVKVAREKLTVKKENERLDKMEEEVRRLEAEVGDD